MSLSASRATRDFRIWAMLLVLEIAAFSLACRLADTGDYGRSAHDSIVVTVLGDMRIAMGEAFYEQADTFFHKGVGHYQPQAFTDWFVKLGQGITPARHAHLQDESISEIMPWLYSSTAFDPQNVTAYAVAAFWLAGEAGRPDLAEQVLAEARRMNPRDYRVYLETGRLAIKQGELRRAARLLETGLRLWPGQQDPDDQQTQIDRTETLMYRGLLYENDGDLASAREMYRKILERFPGRATLKARLDFIETHGRSPSPPFDLWQNMLFRHAEVCDKEKEESKQRH